MGVLSWELFSWVNGIEAACIAGLLWYIYQVRLSCLKDVEKLHGRISDHGNRLHSFMLQVGKDYASVDHLKEVEDRLAGRHKELVDELKGLRKDVQDLTRAMVQHLADDKHVGGT